MANTPRANTLTWLTARNVRTDEPDKGLRGVAVEETPVEEETPAVVEEEETTPRRGRVVEETEETASRRGRA